MISYIGSQKCQNVVWVSKIRSLMWGAKNVKKFMGYREFQNVMQGSQNTKMLYEVVYSILLWGSIFLNLYILLYLA